MLQRLRRPAILAERVGEPCTGAGGFTAPLLSHRCSSRTIKDAVALASPASHAQCSNRRFEALRIAERCVLRQRMHAVSRVNASRSGSTFAPAFLCVALPELRGQQQSALVVHTCRSFGSLALHHHSLLRALSAEVVRRRGASRVGLFTRCRKQPGRCECA